MTMAARHRDASGTARHDWRAAAPRGMRHWAVYPRRAVSAYTRETAPALPQSGVYAVTMTSTKAPCAIKVASTVARAGLAVGK